MYSSFRSHFHISTYKNLKNFILRFHDPKVVRPGTGHAFLLNCHYDSAISSPGASDAFVSCAVMLELSRVLATGNISMHNDVIFLFNGAEESILPASHAFITQHPWSKDVVAFLNLEGAGAGGRMLVFQSGPGASSEILLDAVSSSFERPHADVFAEELFQSGIIPSDTDFRIFRDHGLIPGLDMAYVADGYCYHTPFDTESRISPDCLQKTGEDLLAFVSTILNDRRLESIPKLTAKTQTFSVDNQTLVELSSDDVLPSFRPVSEVWTPSWSRQVFFDLWGLKIFASLTKLVFTVMPVLLLYHVYESLNMLSFFIPVMGRAGHNFSSDVFISACIFAILSPLFLFLAGPLLCTSSETCKNLRLLLVNASLSYAILINASPYGFPYTVYPSSNADDPSVSPRYQRVALFHTNRAFRDTPGSNEVTRNDSYVLLLALDNNGIRYLKPDSYPNSVPSSILSLISHTETKQSTGLYGGLKELSDAEPVICDRSRPYCAIAPMYPYLHYFTDLYHIPAEQHTSAPLTGLRLVSRVLINNSRLPPAYRSWNLTFSIISGPPHTHVLLRTDVPKVRLSNWSFSSGTPVPIPMPLPPRSSKEEKHNTGAHYFLYHIDAAVGVATELSWKDPWIFWLIVDAITNQKSSTMPHAILLVQPSAKKPDTQGVCKIYEEQLKRENPNAPTITYDISQLFQFIDQLADLSCLEFHEPTYTYVPHPKNWIKENIYVLLRNQAGQ
ncbi:hypothetical protein EG68_11654 [Paragonimus skrjabini miyazakii]|uniref:Peptidase M28 domain-containing protein n=1 Tax=Paragonimus skrjabini miyazakii TaxID=59628 RepID=A0A8S9YNA8_9TREM|nr:hypothetical protein EG68_11654 [Paragonimus skrjabini miyazakii]